MANSRKLRSLNKDGDLPAAFERALGDILARVCVSVAETRPLIAIAYSGGLDSSVLLYLASRYADQHDIPLHAFHIHHGLSPHADAWAAHCRAEAGRYRVPFACSKVHVAANDKRGIEQAARVARYEALGELCRQHRVALLLTAHHQDDQAETVLLQLMRGAGLPGLSGMAAYQAHHPLLGPGIGLGRPLLDYSRKALEQEMLRLDLKCINDESNTDIRYRRNALRHSIAPVIESHFPGFAPLVARTASHVQSAQTLLHELATIDMKACTTDSRSWALELAGLQQLSTERVDNVLRHWLYAHGVQLPSTSRLGEIRLQMLESAADTHPFFDFGHVRLHRIDNRLELHPNLGAPPRDPLPLQWQGEREIRVPQWRGRLLFDNTDGAGLEPGRLRNGLLTLRPRSGHERLKVAPNRPSKTLKSLFQELSIAPWQRCWMPLVYLDEDLVFIAGLGMETRKLTEGGMILRWEME
jgi:tRNA(Ile)-lysidine synthase